MFTDPSNELTVDRQYRIAFLDVDPGRRQRRDDKRIPAIAVIDLLNSILVVLDREVGAQ